MELKHGTHFTPIGLLNYLNKHYSMLIPGNKKVVFTLNDIHQYVRKWKKLPDYIRNGSIGIRRCEDDIVGLTYLELYNLDDGSQARL